MSTRSGFVAAGCVLLALAIGAPQAEAQQAAAPLVYGLGEPSMFEAGCLPPCMCPVSNRAPLRGTFNLSSTQPTGSGAQSYYVLDVDWTVPSGTALSHIRGAGTYEIFATAPTRHRLILDLAVDGEEPRRYDSGTVEGGDDFPAIRLPVALYGFFCHDSVYGLDALPRTADVEPPATSAVGLRANPNPFALGTEIQFSLSAPARVRIGIYDLAGREVRALGSPLPLSAGAHRVSWDGRDASGRRAPTGVYFASLWVSGDERRAKLVKLD